MLRHIVPAQTNSPAILVGTTGAQSRGSVAPWPAKKKFAIGAEFPYFAAIPDKISSLTAH